MGFIIESIIIAFLTLFIPGTLLSLALLKNTPLSKFEKLTVGFIFGLIAPATLTWLESYLITYVHAFSFSLGLFEANALILTIVGLILCYKYGVLDDIKAFISEKVSAKAPAAVHEGHGKHTPSWVWWLLFFIMIATFASRISNITSAPNFFEFDPYFDMIGAQYILTYGQQALLSPSAWPVVAAGTNMRLQPIVPYLEAYWYDLANYLGPHLTTFSTSLMSYAGSFYPPITAALLVFTIFMLIYHEYDHKIALIAAGLTASMPILISTFIAGEQLLEPWGIFTLFFFFAAYMLAIRNMKSVRLAIFAGIAFASTFLGAHYYTVDTGVLVIYILAEGIIDVFRNNLTKDFYKMNVIVIAVIAIFLAFYHPYGATLSGRIPSILGIPITVSGPILALVLVALFQYVPKILKERNILFRELNWKAYAEWFVVLAILVTVAIFATPLGKAVRSYLALSHKFTSPSSALFMTVAEYTPTGLMFNFGSNGFGLIGASVAGIPLLVWFISAFSFILILISIFYRRSQTGVLYFAISLPLMVAGFIEVKYIPHFGTAFIMLFAIMIGELAYMASSRFQLNLFKKGVERKELHIPTVFSENGIYVALLLIVGTFFISTILAFIIILYLLFMKKEVGNRQYLWAMFVLFILIEVGALFAHGSFIYGESGNLIASFAAATSTCNSIAGAGNSLAYEAKCNTIPSYWLAATTWMRTNVGPYAPRVLAWWDYGDWINWFGNTNAVLRGDNSVPKEDYATAASFVLGPKYGYNATTLANTMNTNQTKYVVFSKGLVSKWQALDFLACVNINATSEAYAKAAAAAANSGTPYILGTSPCELSHDPQFALLPLAAFVSNGTSQNLGYYCSLPSVNASEEFIKAFLLTGTSLSNQTACVGTLSNSNGALPVYYKNGTKMNAYIQSSQYLGTVGVGNTTFVQFMMIYVPNSANGTITDAPSEFYNSNYYNGFYLGKLPGFHLVYPSNSTGINYVNSSAPLRIFALNNFTGSLPAVPPKPSYVHNNYTMP